MKAFIWSYVEHITNNWHDGGALLVIAPTLEEARKLGAEKHGNDGVKPDLSKEPDFTFDAPTHTEPSTRAFADAGCC